MALEQEVLRLQDVLKDMDEQVDLWEDDLSRPGLYEGPGRGELSEKLRKLKDLRTKRRAEYRDLTGHEPQTAPLPPPRPLPPQPPVPPQPSAPPTAPAISLETDGGTPVPVLYGNQPFHVVVTVPRGAAPPATITVRFHAPGGDRSLDLGWDQGVKGPVRYRSEPITLDAGAEGGSKLSFEMPVHMPGAQGAVGEVRTGGMSGFHIANGDQVTVSISGGAQQVTTTAPAYQTVRDHALEVNQLFLSGMHDYVVRSLIALRPYGDLAAAVEVRKVLTQKLDLLEHAKIVMGDPRNDGPIEQLAYGNAYVRLLREPGLIDMHVEEDMMTQQARNIIRNRYTEIMDGLVKDFGIGFYQFTMSQIPLVGSIWTAVTGTDIMGRKVEGWERVVATLDAAGQAATLGLPVAFQREFAVPRVTARIQGEGVPRAPAEDVLRAPGGTPIAEVEQFGMDRGQVREFRQVLEKHAGTIARKAGVPEQKIYAGVRATGRDALGRASEGFSGKPEPVKSKTTDLNDVGGGWASETGPVVYVPPERVSALLGVTPERITTKVPEPNSPGGYKWQEGPRPEGIKPEVWSRAAQRIAEYHEEAPTMAELLDRGLVRLDEQNRIIDTGVCNYTLDPKTHELQKTFTGPEAGTGKPMYGDPDLYGFWFQDGTMLTPEQIAPILVDLGPRFRMTDQGLMIDGARVLHPDIASWHPVEPKNIAIQAKILKKQLGGAVIDAETGACIGVGPVHLDGEGLIVIGGRSDPALVGYGGVPQVKTIEPLAPVPPGPRAVGPLRSRVVPFAVGGLLLLGIGIGGAKVMNLGPFSTGGSPGAASPAGSAGAARATATPYGLGLTGASAELQFGGFALGACPASDVQYMGKSFSGGWKIAEGPAGVPTDESVNMLALPSSPFGNALNGKIGPTGRLDVGGDSSIEFMHLMLDVPRIPPGTIAAPVNVTGSADVKLHFTGTPALGTVTGDCEATYQATGTIDPP